MTKMDGDTLEVFILVAHQTWDSFVISKNGILREKDSVEESSLREWPSSCNHSSLCRQPCRRSFQWEQYKTTRLKFDGYFVSHLMRTLIHSELLRVGVIRNVQTHMLTRWKGYVFSNNNKAAALVISLQEPEHEVIDLIWNEIITKQVQEVIELAHTMSWLSTLGGGFSALGDHHSHCALVAGKISLKQLLIAQRLGDPILVSKCKLYAALSLLQRGHLGTARRIIEAQYEFARSLPQESSDATLLRMCLGIWAKLRYTWKLQRRSYDRSER